MHVSIDVKSGLQNRNKWSLSYARRMKQTTDSIVYETINFKLSMSILSVELF